MVYKLRIIFKRTRNMLQARGSWIQELPLAIAQVQLSQFLNTPVPWGAVKKSAGCTGSCTTFTDSCSARQNPFVFF